MNELKSLVQDTITQELQNFGVSLKNEILREIRETNKLNEKKSDEEWKRNFGRVLQAIYTRNEVELRAVLGTSGAANWVPQEFSQKVVEQLYQENPFRQFATVFPVSEKKGYVPRFVVTGTPGITAEGATYSDITPASLDAVSFSLEKLAGYIQLTKELVSFSQVQIVDLFIKHVAQWFAQKERDLFVNGSGTNQPKGIRSETYTAIAWSATDVYGTLLQAYYAVKPQYRSKAVWLTSGKGRRLLAAAKDSTGRPLFPEVNNPQPMLLGRPLYEIPEIPENLGVGADETEIYFGDFSYYYIFDFKGGEIESDRNDIIGFLTDVVYIKFAKYVDGKMAYFADKVNVVKISAVK